MEAFPGTVGLRSSPSLFWVTHLDALPSAVLQYTVYFPKDRKYVQVQRGKEGSPRARRAFERLLEEALVRGQAEGWVEFQSNIDKFVTCSGGAGAAEEGAVDGRSAGMKRKRGTTGTLPVVRQTRLWEGDGEDAGDGDVAGEVVDDEDGGDVDDDDDDAEDSEVEDSEEDEDDGDLEKDGEDEDDEEEDDEDEEEEEDEDDGSGQEARGGPSAVASGTGDAEATQSSSGKMNNGVGVGEDADSDAMPELKDDFFLEEKGSDDGQNAEDAAIPQALQGRKRNVFGEGERSGRGWGGRGGRQSAREDGGRGWRRDRGGRAQMGGRGYQSNRAGKFEDLRGRGGGGLRGRSDVIRGGRGDGPSRGFAANGSRGGRRETSRGRGGIRGGRSPVKGSRLNKKTRFGDSDED